MLCRCDPELTPTPVVESLDVVPPPDGVVEPAVNRVKRLWSLNPSLGGPIVRDRLWFFGAYSRVVADAFTAFLNDADPNALTYSPSNEQTIDDQGVHAHRDELVDGWGRLEPAVLPAHVPCPLHQHLHEP